MVHTFGRGCPSGSDDSLAAIYFGHAPDEYDESTRTSILLPNLTEHEGDAMYRVYGLRNESSELLLRAGTSPLLRGNARYALRFSQEYLERDDGITGRVCVDVYFRSCTFLFPCQLPRPLVVG